MSYVSNKLISLTRHKRLLVFLSIAVAAVTVVILQARPEETKITTSYINNIGQGTIVSGDNDASQGSKLRTDDHLVYQSKEIVPEQQNANAAAIKWQSTGDATNFEGVQLRTFNGQRWTDWSESDQFERKDGTAPPDSTLILTDKIKKIQYRIELEGEGSQTSPEIDLDSLSLEVIDTTKGPTPTKKSAVIRLLNKVGIMKTASARTDGPRIITRAEWGSPEPDSSPSWTTDYRPLTRAIVHHTVTTGSDHAATMRAIWHFHAISRGWGDIGYNYTVDTEGNIYQGRYFDHKTADDLWQDVVGGHALDNNQGTTGIAALGDYTNQQPNDRVIDSIAKIIAFKLAPYGVKPSEGGPQGANVIGHRDVNSTACPAKIYDRIPDIRKVADRYYVQRAKPYAWQHVSQQVYADAARTQPLSGTPTLQPGATGYVRIKARNVGYTAWNQSTISLGTARPLDRTSTFTNGSWLNAVRPTRLVEATVQPGQVGTFDFSITAPATPGTYREHFNIVAEGITWLNDLSLNLLVNVLTPVGSFTPSSTGLDSGQQLLPKGNILSPDRQSSLTLEPNGNLVLTNDFQPRWSSQTSGYSPKNLLMQTDGNLVLYSNNNQVLWNSETQGNPGAKLELQTDGNMVIKSVSNTTLWSSNTLHTPNYFSYVNTILHTGKLYPGQELTTADRKFRMLLQTDGNLVVYSPNRHTWATGTDGRQVSFLAMQPDGNLVLYDINYKPIWYSGTNGTGISALMMQPDGNLVLYNGIGIPTWHTQTNGVQ